MGLYRRFMNLFDNNDCAPEDCECVDSPEVEENKLVKILFNKTFSARLKLNADNVVLNDVHLYGVNDDDSIDNEVGWFVHRSVDGDMYLYPEPLYSKGYSKYFATGQRVVMADVTKLNGNECVYIKSDND